MSMKFQDISPAHQVEKKQLNRKKQYSVSKEG